MIPRQQEPAGNNPAQAKMREPLNHLSFRPCFLDQFRNRYPAPHTVSMYSGDAESDSIFSLSLRI